ncbi:MAG: tRNA (cytidine(56)-2'-O)-methyltransferase [Methanobrevibacter sp.]|jgi:tRNA (cytidine56-2'-O)-methyltransferase|nr:tRNA (cytidine(56)-2'-O)-methyltransferase [Candidatus Methanoflexus mossambicus]
MKIQVLRLSHRFDRDTRITTHVCLTARAFGAEKVYFSGDKETSIIDSVEDVVKRWGGDFQIEYTKNHIKIIKEWKNKGGEVIHLTMYGEQANEIVNEIKKSNKDKLIVVGGSKVEIDVYEKADWNVSITTQPHSEVSSLAIFQHLLTDGNEFNLKFDGAKLQVSPMAKGKRLNVKK